MKLLSTLFVMLMTLSLSCGSALAQQVAHAEDRELFLQYLATVEAALNEGDIEKIIPLLRDDIVVTFVNAEVTRGIPAIREYFDKVLGESNALLADYKTQAKVSAPARFFGTTAIADGTSVDTYTFPNGEVMDMDTQWNVTLVKENEVWQLAQLNFSASPFDNPIMQGIQNRIILFSVIALLVGWVIGFFVGRRSKKSA